MNRSNRSTKRSFARGALFAAVGVSLAGATLAAVPDDGPDLGSARGFAVLAGSTVTNAGASAVTGDVGVSPGTSITGFPPGTVSGGSFYAGDATAAQAQVDAAAAYAFLEGMASDTDLSGTDLGGLTLTPGVYSFASSAQLTGDLVLDAECDPDALFVFQIGSTLTTAAGATVTVIHGDPDYDESRLFWKIGSSATLGAGTLFKGILLAQTSLTLSAGVVLDGNALAMDGSVSLDAVTIVSPPLVVDTSTMLFVPDWGHVTDAKAGGRDQFKVAGSYSYVGSPDEFIDPVSDGISISVRVAGETSPLLLTLLPDAPGWKVTNGGTSFVWTGTGDGGEPWGITLHDADKTFILWAQAFDLSPGDGVSGLWGPANAGYVVPFEIDIVTGNDSASSHTCFRNSLTFNGTLNWGVLRLP